LFKKRKLDLVSLVTLEKPL